MGLPPKFTGVPPGQIAQTPTGVSPKYRLKNGYFRCTSALYGHAPTTGVLRRSPATQNHSIPSHENYAFTDFPRPSPLSSSFPPQAQSPDQGLSLIFSSLFSLRKRVFVELRPVVPVRLGPTVGSGFSRVCSICMLSSQQASARLVCCQSNSSETSSSRHCCLCLTSHHTPLISLAA